MRHFQNSDIPAAGKSATAPHRSLDVVCGDKLKRIGPLGWHGVYFAILCLLSSALFYAAGRRGIAADGSDEKMSYLDAVFLGVTSVTDAGLVNVVLSRLNTFQQIVAFLLILLGSQTWVAACVVNIQRARLAQEVRKRALEEAQKKKRGQEEQRLGQPFEQDPGKARGDEGVEKQDLPAVLRVPPLSPVPVSRPAAAAHDKMTPLDSAAAGAPAATISSTATIAVSPYPTIAHTPARVSRKVSNINLSLEAARLDQVSMIKSKRSPVQGDLDDELQQQNNLAALTLLSWIIPTYLFLFQILSAVSLGAWMASNSQGIEKNGINVWWWGAFNSISSFANSGMSLLDANMVPFQARGSFVVWVQGILILAGNSAFPLFLRVILLCMKRIGRGEKAGVRVLLGAKGRKVFPYMFNRRETLWLWATLCLLNGIDWVAFEIAASTDPRLRRLSIPRRLLCGLFQAFSVRSGGFAIVSIRELDVSVQMIYTVMLYISAFPVALRYTPHYKSALSSRSLSTWEFVKFQLHGLMRAGDLRYLATAVWIITVIETRSATDLLPNIFEVASAFGCVGVSFGAVGDGSLSLVGDWRGVSKMVLAAVMLWGRVREVRRGILKGWGQGLLDSHLEKDAEEFGTEKVV